MEEYKEYAWCIIGDCLHFCVNGKWVRWRIHFQRGDSSCSREVKHRYSSENDKDRADGKRGRVMTKEIHDINTKALDFVAELIEYIFEYPDDDYMTMECLCRKLVKHGLLDKADGYYQTHEIRTNTHECVKDTHDKTENCSEKPNNCEPKICDFCRYYNSNIPCGSTPSACKEADKFAKEFVDGLRKCKGSE